jgi:hypothetical protein
MTIKLGDTVLYKTPMQQIVEAKVVGVTDNDENPDEPFLDLTLVDPTFNQEFTVREIEREPACSRGRPTHGLWPLIRKHSPVTADPLAFL